MCSTCGCDGDGARLVDLDAEPDFGHAGGHSHPHDHAHGHDHEHPNEHSHAESRTVVLEQAILAKNDLLAAQNRGWLQGRGVRAVNLMSSPGSGKTTLLERTIRSLDGPLAVIEGDQETAVDARRIRAAGCPVVQVNTGSGCHLDAEMVGRALHRLDPAAGSVLFIENVGNLVCPALFDLGEESKVVIMSVTEGADKPMKYPHMFRGADVVVLNKIDLLPYVDFDTEEFERQLRKVNPRAGILAVSATRGEGMQQWYEWLAGESAQPSYMGTTTRRTVPSSS